MKSKPRPSSVSSSEPPKSEYQDFFRRLFTLALGSFLGLTLLKFGTPCVMEKFIERPRDFWGWVFNPWPVGIAYWLLGFTILLGAFNVRWKTRVPTWVLLLPLLWLGWQFIAATQSVDAVLSRGTMHHFIAGVACFYLGFYCLGRGMLPVEFWMPLMFSYILVLAVGFQQHFGGLESTRTYFYTYIYPTLPEVPPELLKKIQGDRIFSTTFYPNSLAGVILMLLPMMLGVTKVYLLRLTPAARWMVGLILLVGSLACLNWSGSKAGWLLLVVLGIIYLLHLGMPRRARMVIVVSVLAFGLAGFLIKYGEFFRSGATSVHARFDYWQAALDNIRLKPVFGSGPGTFGVIYQGTKDPESEMSRMTHNDYLQQASDSGVAGGLLFLALVGTILVRGYDPSLQEGKGMRFGVWLGVLGVFLQSTAEFGFYIPGLAWPALCLGGWLVANSPKRFDTPSPSG